MLGYANYQVERAQHQPVVAVHEFRKSIRRCRSMLQLLRHSLPSDVFRRLRTDLRTVHRSTSQLRDRDVVLNTLDQLMAEVGSAVISADVSVPARDRIASVGANGPDLALTTLRRAEPALRDAQTRLRDGLSGKVRWRAVARDLERTYRQARRSMRHTERGRDNEALHDWRKRTKELVYQVELLHHGASRGKGRKLRRQLGRLAETLGQVIDLFVLEEYVCEHVAEAQQGPLLAAIAQVRDERQLAALDLGEQLFRRKPKAFSQRLIARTKRAHRRHRSTR